MNAPIIKLEFEISQILAAATARGRQKQLPYAGELTPRETYQLCSAPGANIIDVRSHFEHKYIGHIPASTLIPWKHWPGGEFNEEFLVRLQNQCALNDIVLFLCRSGVRSHAAAALAAKAGFTKAFNIIEGFEGDLDSQQQRGRLGGWRYAGLPWIQD